MSDAETDFDGLLPDPHLDRRGFVVTLAAAGFALAVQPVQAQSVVTTDSAGLDTGAAGIDVEGGRLPLYWARPAGGAKAPVVLVVQEIFGVHEHIKDICRRLAKVGYFALAPELYFRYGDPGKLESVPAIFSGIVSKVPDAEVMADLDASAAWAVRQGGDAARMAITGFCWGGRIVWLYAAHNPRLKAAAAWYGRLDGTPDPLTPKHPLDVVDELQVPVLGLYGGQDQSIPVSDVEAMRAALAKAGKPAEIVIYPDAPHAFNADYRPSYRKEAATDAWRRMLDWFKRYGV
jgi:carboxymethylenebutenolidase